MKVRWKAISGMVHGVSVAPGRVTEVPDEDGARYCKLGYCTPVVDEEEPEKAVVTPEVEERASEQVEVPNVKASDEKLEDDKGLTKASVKGDKPKDDKPKAK